MNTYLLFKKGLLALAIGGVLSASVVLVPDSISHDATAYAKDGGGGGGGGQRRWRRKRRWRWWKPRWQRRWR
jgi:hypothetical protein